MEKKEIEYPIRINRYLALKGYFTRRGADELITQKRVKINGRVAKLGDKVKAGDKVDVSSAGPRKTFVYFAYYKPEGIVTHTPQEGERSITQVFKHKENLFPLGRLDKNSEGLIILTNDGRITDRLLNPDYGHEKEYLVKVNKPIDREFVRRMTKGVPIEGYKTKPADFDQMGDKNFKLIITEGKKHQIRRMCTALGYEVIWLKRVRIMNVTLGNLRSGEGRELKGKELEIFLKNLGL